MAVCPNEWGDPANGKRHPPRGWFGPLPLHHDSGDLGKGRRKGRRRIGCAGVPMRLLPQMSLRGLGQEWKLNPRHESGITTVLKSLLPPMEKSSYSFHQFRANDFGVSGARKWIVSRKKADSSLQLINFNFSWTWQGKQECHQAQTYSCKEKETRSSPVTIRKEGALGGCMFTVKVVVS